MMLRLFSLIIIASFSLFQIYAQDLCHWLHIYRNSENFLSTKLDDVRSISHILDGQDEPMMHIALSDDDVFIPISDVSMCEIGTNVPAIYIVTPASPDLVDIVDKDTYVDALISVEGMGMCDDLPPTPVFIKGRGNSTWNYPKKPYRLKFPKKTDLCGITRCKNYALIANYIDCSLMRNAVAFEIARLLQMPFTNHVFPVRVYFNGILKGAYFITEKIGISGSSVNIDEDKGVLFELDGNYDEKYRFRSPIYDLPVMIKDPDLDEIAAEQGTSPDSLLEKWAERFNVFESKVYSGTLVDGIDYDMASLVDFLIVYNLCGNREISWPKSTFIYMTDLDSPLTFGPVWDFDWAFTYNNGCEDKDPNSQLLAPWHPLLGQPFFKTLCSDVDFKVAYGKRWQYFCDELLPLLYIFIDDYASQIRPSAVENGILWPSVAGISTSSFDFDGNLYNLRNWISARVEYISFHPNFGLYDD